MIKKVHPLDTSGIEPDTTTPCALQGDWSVVSCQPESFILDFRQPRKRTDPASRIYIGARKSPGVRPTGDDATVNSREKGNAKISSRTET